MDLVPIKRALVSVTDKTGVAEFCKALQQEFGTEIISTGGSAKALSEAGLKVRPIEDFTGFPEMMDGRVKTLHPKVHGALLARRDLDSHMQEAAAHDIQLIDMVIVNLYAFEDTVAKPDVSYADAIEHIDIGGPSMLRSAAKNHDAVAVVVNPTGPLGYDAIITELRRQGGSLSLATRKRLALEVFRKTSAYDNAIYRYLLTEQEPDQKFPQDVRIFLDKAQDLRYGENPHQPAAFYRRLDQPKGFDLAHAEQLQGKEMSYNNFLDVDATWTAVREFSDATCVIVKHLTPCGICTSADLVDAYQRAWECDSMSAYGGIVAFNRPVPVEVIQRIIDNKQFMEAIIAPEFSDAAIALLAERKKNCRVLRTHGINPLGSIYELRSVEGGVLMMQQDAVEENPAEFTVPTKRKPSDQEMEDLLFAWKCVKSVKSNAICLAKDHAMVGAGAGQPNRVNSSKLAVEQAGDKARGAVAASDAFFPFADGLEALAEVGVTAVIEPGGSIRDQEVIEAADKAGVALLFTGHRHFRH
ncbi:MAG: bifunctional phosphoribosylaminoimidazolecarboxamide formyltransferase/IMP cyclohydrolase [Coriobacteriales bacterium]|jgi:phosphoribosylaminoimidazolecarboxamide formyltransferase/IMP cyclohydrolase|nr:bifunctional phosphoribosylaminoimidazolecarboxamide formyltransferase/IMP cyclohydrolase [Coriobacteriales bacterium]